MHEPVSVIDGRCGRKLNNALTMTFFEGSEEPMASALQGAGDGVGKKMVILFGFKNGAVGRHALTFADGRTLLLESASGPITRLVTEDGRERAVITRGPTSVAAVDGRTLFTFQPGEDAKAPDRYRIRVDDATGEQVAALDVIRLADAWHPVGELTDLMIYGLHFQTGRALSLPLLGTRLVTYRVLTDSELDVLLGVCVDIGISIRPYIAEMGAQGAAST